MNTSVEILKVRKRLKLTQRQFSKLTGIERTLISKYESGVVIPPGDVLLSIMRREFPVVKEPRVIVGNTIPNKK